MWIIVNRFLAQNRDRHGSGSYDGIMNKRVQSWQHVTQTPLERSFVQNLASIGLAIKMHELNVGPRHEMFGIVAEKYNGGVSRTIVLGIVQTHGSHLFLDIAIVTIQCFFVKDFG